MLTISYRVAALVAAGAVLVGWLSASLVVPPALISQERARAPRDRATAPPIPPLALDAVRSPRVRPGTHRNPFAFAADAGEAAPRRTEAPGATPSADAPPNPAESAAITAAAPLVPWRLAGMASDDARGFTAVLSGDGEVHLVRTGDTLGTTTIEELSATSVTLRLASGDTVVLRLQ